MLYPLTFHPIFKERVWGGRRLEQLYRKPLPPTVPIGESWEISDRPGDASVVANGPLAGKDLHWLMENHRAELLGKSPSLGGRFPLLIKILDAQDKLSLQVHPPAARAVELGGEPKTEMWFIADAAPGAELFVGLKRGVSRPEFESKLRSGKVAECFHRVPVHTGDAMFLPSGRVHAIGAGLLIFEVQQNSDTTYRVFDWNRVGLDGKPRALHIPESLASIDFDDYEPSLVTTPVAPSNSRPLVNDVLFSVSLERLERGEKMPLGEGAPLIIGVTQGRLKIHGAQISPGLEAGQFCLIPASVKAEAIASDTASFLLVQTGQ